MDSQRCVIVIPAYNEAPTVGEVVGLVRKQGFRDVIVVDDGSTDGTADMAKAAGALVVRHPINRGAGAATRTGFEAARQLGADVLVTLDADGQHDPAEISRLMSPLLAGEADVVVGARYLLRGRMPLMTRLFNVIANAVTWALSGVWCSDSQSGFRAYSRRAVERLDIRSSGFEFCSEVSRELKQMRLAMVEVPVTTHYPSQEPDKGQNYSTGLETVLRLFIRSLMR